MVMAAVIGGSALIGAGASVYGASKAADAQSKASERSIAAQEAQNAQNRADAQPFVQAGYSATNKLTGQLDSLTAPFQMTQANLEATPGYQFNLSQGLKATQNSAAARGLGISGAAMKGAAAYATGLADSTYTNQFNMDQTNKTNAYNKLMGVSSLGANANSGVMNNGTQISTNVGNTMTGIGNAQAGAYMAGANGIASAANGLGNFYMQNKLTSGMYTPSAFPTGGGLGWY